MAIQHFSESRLDDLRHLYCEDKLFRTFSPVLCELQEKRQELHPVILWHEVEALRNRLRVANFPETEVPFLINYLRGHLTEQLTEDNKTIVRSESEVVESMLCILLLLFFQLSDGAKDAENIEDNPNHVTCVALAHILTDPQHEWYVEPMRRNLTLKKTDLLGNKIVLPVVDYMQMKVSLDAMDAIAKQNYERIFQHIQELSVGLKQYLHIEENTYLDIWTNICADGDLFLLMSKKDPRTYSKNFNFKMFCNVLGILQNTTLESGQSALEKNVQNVNDAIGTKNNRNYITYYKQFDTDCAYNEQQYNRINRIVSDTLRLPTTK